MRVLVVGGGAREHILGETLVRAGSELHVLAAQTNPGLAEIAKRYEVGHPEDGAEAAALARKRKIELAVIGPEAPLASGVADALRAAGVPTVGPSRSAARVESSKRFCRELLAKHGIEASPRWVAVERREDVAGAVAGFGATPFVIKPVGLSSGKGVLVQGADFATPAEGAALAERLFATGLGGAGVLLEERLEGEEFSLMAFVTDSGVYPMPLVQDHKRALQGGAGGNTGGMGSYSQRDHLLPFLSAAHRDDALDVLKETAAAMTAEGLGFRGVLYGGFMLTSTGPKLLEYNARFGDPEALNALLLYEPGNFEELLLGVANGRVDPDLFAFRLRATVVKYVVPVGYGAVPQLGSVVEYDRPAIEDAGVHLYFGSVEAAGPGKVRLGASRGLALVGEASAVWEAGERVEAALQFVKGSYYVRHDIATREELAQRVEHMRRLFSPAAKPSPLPLSVAAPDAPPSSAGPASQLLGA